MSGLTAIKARLTTIRLDYLRKVPRRDRRGYQPSAWSAAHQPVDLADNPLPEDQDTEHEDRTDHHLDGQAGVRQIELQHFDEGCAHQAIRLLTELLNEQEPIKRPLFEQRLRRLEEFADDVETRLAAAELRRSVRA